MSVVVTGAGGDIGRSLVARLRADGWSVGALDISEEALARLADDGKAPLHRAITDVRDLASIKAGIAAVEEALGPVEVLINNAGGITSPSLRTTSEFEF